MYKRRNKTKLKIVIVLFLIVSIAIGYARLSSSLTINGTARIKQNSWLIYFDNVKENVSSIEASEPAYITNKEKTNIDFGVMFNLPGDFYEFDTDIRNDGTIDAAIEDVYIRGFSEEQKGYMSFSVLYTDGTEIKKCDLLPAGEHVSVRVRVDFKEDISNEQLATMNGNANLHFQVDYIQAYDGCNNPIPMLNTKKVIIDPNGGTYPGELLYRLRENETLEILTPTNPGYEFKGWTVSSPENFNNNIITMGTENITLTAEWEMTGEPVARLNDPDIGDEFPTIQAAIRASSSGDTIYLLKDVTESPNNNKTVTLDLQEHKVTGELTNTGNITIINGCIENTNGSAVENTGTVTLGIDDGSVSIDSVSLIGTDIGINQRGTFNFYDGFIEGIVGINGGYDDIPINWFVLVDHNNTKNCQKVYLVEEPTNAVAKTIKGKPVFYFNLQDAINTVELNPMDIYIVRNFEAAYTLTVKSGVSATIDLDGYTVNTGDFITNNGRMIIRDTNENKGLLRPAKSLINKNSLYIQNTFVEGSTESPAIQNEAKLYITNSTLSGHYAIYNTEDGTITMDDDTYIQGEEYGIKNDSENAVITKGNIGGIYSEANLQIKETNITSQTYLKDGTYYQIKDTTFNVNENSCILIEYAHATIEGTTMNCTNSNGIYVSYNSSVHLTDTNITADYSVINLYYSSNDISPSIIDSGTYISNSTPIYMQLSDIIINGGTFKGSDYSSIINSSDSSKVTINGGTFQAENSSAISMSNTSLTVNGGTITSATEAAIITRSSYWSYPCYIKLNGGYISGETGIDGTFYRTYIEVNTDEEKEQNLVVKGNINGITNGGSLTINTPKDLDTTTIIEGGIYGVYNNYADIIIGTENNEMTTNVPVIKGDSYGIYTENGSVSFYDGILKGRVAPYNDVEISTIQSGYNIKKGTEEIDGYTYETAYLGVMSKFLRVGEEEFLTLPEAIEAITSEGTIYVIDDGAVRENIETPSTKNITIDLNGHELTFTKKLTTNGDLTIIDSSSPKKGKIISHANESFLYAKKSLTIDGVTINSYYNDDYTSSIFCERDYNLNESDQQLLIKDSNITTSGVSIYTGIPTILQNSTITGGGRYVVTTSETNMTILSGTYTSTSEMSDSAVIEGYATITINGGTFENEYGTCIEKRNQPLTINAGTFTTKYGNTITTYYNTTNINGGTFYQTNDQSYYTEYAAIAPQYGTININGGTIISNNHGILTQQETTININKVTITANKAGIYSNHDDSEIYINVDGSKEGNVSITGENAININKGIVTINTPHTENATYTTIIKGTTDGVKLTGGIIVVGTENNGVSLEKPVVIGENNGIYVEDGDIYFYDGILKGQDKSYDAIDIKRIQNGYTVTKGSETIEGHEYETAYLTQISNFLRVGTDEFNNFADAIEAISTTGTIIVIENAISKELITIPSEKTITLNLNGYQIEITNYFNNLGSLTIIDNSTSKTGVILSKSADNMFQTENYLKLDGVKIRKYNPEIVNYYEYNYVFEVKSGTCDIFNSDITSESAVIFSQSLQTTLQNSQITSPKSLAYLTYGNDEKTELVINSGTYTTTEENSIYGYGVYTINGGNIINTCDMCNGISLDGYQESVINGGYIESKGITIYSRYNLTINGGTIKSLESSAIDASEGDLIINGGEINGEIYGINLSREWRGSHSAYLYAYGGTIKGGTIGINAHAEANSTSVVIGKNDLNITRSPVIIGQTYGMYIDLTTEVKFYDGIIKGVTDPYYGGITDIATNAMPVNDTEIVEGVTYKREYLELQDVFVKNGEKGYTDLRLAFSEAAPTDNLIMIKDVEIFYEVEVESGKVINLNMNGKSLQTSKTITNNGTLNITDSSSNNDNYIKIATNAKPIENNHILNISKMDIRSINCIVSYASTEINLDYVEYIATDKALEIYGSLSINHSTIEAPNYAIYFYDTGGATSIDNSTITGTLSQALYSNSHAEITTNNTNFNGEIYINENDQIVNYTNGQVNGSIYNNGTLNLDEVDFNYNGSSYATIIGNNGILNIEDGDIYVNPSDNSYVYLTGINNRGTANITNVNIDFDLEGGWGRDYSKAVYSEGADSKLTYNGGTITINNIDQIYGIYIESEDTNETTITADINILNQYNDGYKYGEAYGLYNNGTGNNIKYEGNIDITAATAYGLYGNNGKITILDGTIEANGSNTAYGAYLNYGELVIGEYDGRGTTEVIDNVSLTNPLISALGNNNSVGVYLGQGSFRFFDGKVIGVSTPIDGTITQVEYLFEARTYDDAINNYKYATLQYLPN